MPNRRLSRDEMNAAKVLLSEIRARLESLAAGNRDLLFAFRRKVYKELIYDERDKPMARRKLKVIMHKAQNGLRAICLEPLPATYNVLDRFNAADGYVESNVRLICQLCDRRVQTQRGYA